MPDLSIEVYFHCLTCENWEMKIPSSKGDKEYTVRFQKMPRNHEVQYDYVCDCTGFKMRRKCSHIETAKLSGKHCKWMQFTDGGKPVVKNGENCCPKCSGPVNAWKWGV